MNQTQEVLIKNNYRKMVEKCLADILKEYKLGQGKVSQEEHELLCLRLRNLLISNINMYFFRVSLLSPTQLKLMIMRMDYALFRQCFVSNEHKQIAYALQFKMEFENNENSLRNILRKLG